MWRGEVSLTHTHTHLSSQIETGILNSEPTLQLQSVNLLTGTATY